MRTSEFGANHVVYFTIMQSKKVRIMRLHYRLALLIDFYEQLYAWETGSVDDLALFLLCGDVVDIKVGSGCCAIKYDSANQLCVHCLGLGFHRDR